MFGVKILSTETYKKMQDQIETLEDQIKTLEEYKTEVEHLKDMKKTFGLVPNDTYCAHCCDGLYFEYNDWYGIHRKYVCALAVPCEKFKRGTATIKNV